MSERHHTRIEDAAVFGGRWVRVGDVEVTALPLVDTARSLPNGMPLFARLTYSDALRVADRMGARLVSRETLEAMCRQATTILEPFTLPADALMSTVERSEKHDAEMWRRLDALQDDEDHLVLGVGKHFIAGAPSGRAYLMGWWTEHLERYGARRGAGWVQQGAAPGTPGPHSADGVRDYGTTTVLERTPGGPQGGPGGGGPGWLTRTLKSAGRAVQAAVGALLMPFKLEEVGVQRSTIRAGARGALVVELQKMLGVSADGVFGPGTEAAVKAFQRAQGLDADGVVGPATWLALDAAPRLLQLPRKPAGDPRAPACVAALRDANAAWPTRKKASDGIMGDARHQAKPSDHNLGNAVDITHDPESGCDGNLIATDAQRDPRVSYIIWNAQIWNPAISPSWRPYKGSNPHRHHVHISVRADRREDALPWPWAPPG